MTSTLSLCIICHDRPSELGEALRSAAAEAWHEVIVLDMASDPPIDPVPGLRWIRSDVNLGVTGGRNLLADAATGDILVFLDDDAVLLSAVGARLAAAFDADRSLGAVAFRIHRPGRTGTRLEHPFRGSGRGSLAEGRACSYFVGCGYAIRRCAHIAVGGYDDRFFYSTEEVDLAFRLIRDGWRLRYDPTVEVEHRPSPRGRGASSAVPGWRLRNRVLLARAHLPAPLAALHVAVWAAKTAVEALRAGSTNDWWRLAAEGVRIPVERRPLPWALLLQVHRMGGRVLY